MWLFLHITFSYILKDKFLQMSSYILLLNTNIRAITTVNKNFSLSLSLSLSLFTLEIHFYFGKNF